MWAETFDDFYRDARPRVVAAVAVSFGNAHLAGDAADEAFVRALARWSRVSTMDSPLGWTVQVALNVARRQTRRAAFEARVLGRQRPVSELAGPAGEIWAVVATLPERQRQVVVLRYLADLAEDEIGRQLGISRSAVSSALTDARRRLHRLVTEPDVEVDHV